MAINSIFFFKNITKPTKIGYIWWDLVSYTLIRQNYKIEEEIYQVLVTFGPKMAEIGKNSSKIGDPADFASLIYGNEGLIGKSGSVQLLRKTVPRLY